MKTEQKNSNKIVLRVTDNEEYFDDSSDAAVIEITPALKGLLLKARKQFLRLKTELGNGIYDIRFFNSDPEFLCSGEFSGITDAKTEKQLHDKGALQITEELFKKLITGTTVPKETVLLQVGEHSFFWTGYYKHTNVRFQTEGFLFSDLEKMK